MFALSVFKNIGVCVCVLERGLAAVVTLVCVHGREGQRKTDAIWVSMNAGG